MAGEPGQEDTVRPTVTFFALLITIAVSATPKRKASSPPVLLIQSQMTKAQFDAAGLSKLSPSELLKLNQWLNAFAISLISPKRPPDGESVIDTEISGEFEGWSGETIFKLSNGQIWQQAEYDYEYEYEYNPKVMIYRKGGEYRMKVEGLEVTVAVKRIK